MTVKQRLTQFIKHKNISVRNFESTIGVSYGYVTNIRVSIQPDKISSISHHFPELNISWLITGEGEMLKQNPDNLNEPIYNYEKKHGRVENSNNPKKDEEMNYQQKPDKEETLLSAIDRMTRTAENNSVSIQEMVATTKSIVETADRNSRMLERMMDYFFKSQKGGEFQEDLDNEDAAHAS